MFFVSFFKYVALVFSLLVMFSTSAQAVDIVSTDGKPSQLNSEVSEGDWSLVMLWSHDCIPCEKQKPMIERFHKRTESRGVSVVGLSTDEKTLRAQATQTYKATRTSFPNFYFDGQNFQKDYQRFVGRNFIGTPTYMVFSPSGELTGVHTGAITRTMLEKEFGSKLKEKSFTPSVDLMQ